MRKIAIVSLTAMTAMTGACSNVDTGYGLTTYEVAGMVAGGFAGGTIGAEIGGGMGKMISIATGALIGTGAGYVAGSMLNVDDQAAYDKSAQQALNSASDGSVSNWSNLDSGNGGIIIPTRSYVTRDGRNCREYRVTHAIKAEGSNASAIIRKDGAACQQADGSWQKLEEDMG
ncbi:MAG: hypothetical protein HOK06_08440 [Rhodospirillaceae bacterium]|jgi:surface antigen|nr:hypothetical protein [Rhodospirillaceae bacterium]MBT4463756.1 hypothetical protein [Rhodospirillaceae bacterium]MBT5014404.1 hypothetical protein [Rhodospirillaceae bacterium]MBT5308619.1 hypothetical protein [Rhodospirillaceae bacterium]MBT6407619.1 hypothetical protein [Rhodospirillaceae bacterium]